MIQQLLQNIGARWAGLHLWAKLAVAIVAIVIIGVFLTERSASKNTTMEIAHRGPLARTVLASGTVISKTDLSLSFQATQIVQSIKVDVGQKVKKGQLLAALSNASEQAAVKSAQGALLAARARYQKILDGASNESIALAEVALKNAKDDRGAETAKQKLYSAGLTAKPFDSLSATSIPSISGTYTGDTGTYYISYSITDPMGKVVRLTGLETGAAQVSMLSPQALGTKGLFVQFPAGAVLANGMEWTVSIPNTESNGYAAAVSDYQKAVDAHDAAVATAQAQLAVTRATARQADIDAAMADIVTAQAAVDSATAVLEKTIIRAPADGTVTKVAIHLGDTVKANDTAIVVQDISNLYIEANVNESNIANIVIGQQVQVTYDAFGKDATYQATISSVDLSPTVVSGIVNYKIKAVVSDASAVKPGMTANLSIQTAYLPDVVIIPQRVISEKNGTKTVRVVAGKDASDKTVVRVVTTGLVGDGDMVEVSSGLSDGDKVTFAQQ